MMLIVELCALFEESEMEKMSSTIARLNEGYLAGK